MYDRLARLYKISQMIYFDKVNRNDLAKEFNVSQRTVSRDMKTLKDDIGLPIHFDKANNCYQYYKEDMGLLVDILFDWINDKSYNHQFKKPYFITNHAIESFQKKIFNLRPAEIIFLLQYWLQRGEPFEIFMHKGKPTWTFRRDLLNKPVYIPVTINKGREWPVVPTIHGGASKVHGKYIKGELEYA